MTKEQEEAIENLTDLLKQRNEKQVEITTYDLFENIETVLSMLKEKDKEIEKKDKIIDLMAKYIAKEDKTNKFCDYKTVCDNDCEECVEAYFRESEEE